ncbi:FecR family protein [Pedobacter arcticus]|uniref:FecR family protein n=1 Tax=Pedobacter arcticus TaxID=752140 RepID=UPI000318EB47|nr:FecR family protein [Pedobacter arcticus]
MDKEDYKKLLEKYLNNELVEDELSYFLEQTATNEEWFYENFDQIDETKLGGIFDDETGFQNILSHTEFSNAAKENTRSLIPTILRYAAIFIVFGAVSLVAYQYFSNDQTQNFKDSTTLITKSNITLSENSSLEIKLADGTHLQLDEGNFNKRIKKEGITIDKDKDGLVVLQLTAQKHIGNQPVGFHELSTPRGEGFTFQLPDGSKVWLNTTTKIKIPEDFNLKNRTVYLEGEAFFDVAHNASKPFLIHTDNDIVKVLGTAFNVKSYSQDKTSFVTLVRGSVQVNSENKQILLSPGEQSVSNKSSGDLAKKKVDVDQFIAWKNGYFKFVDQPIHEIIKELIKWYDIKEVKYEVDNKERFTASIKRSRNLSDVLSNIEKISNLQFTIKEGRLIVKEK